jgi:hypothetical protein
VGHLTIAVLINRLSRRLMDLSRVTLDECKESRRVDKAGNAIVVLTTRTCSAVLVVVQFLGDQLRATDQ